MSDRFGSGSPAAAGFRPEVEGLRAVAALLVAAYHVWLGRVSGGVDVFFVISGYLITDSLLRQAERDGRLDIGAFWMRLVRRLAPGAFLVLAAVTLGSALILPQVRWFETASEILAAALYVENWRLALNAVDYLARETPPSPVQHYWALSVQAQFYLLWPFLAIVAFALSRRLGTDRRRVLATVIGAVLSASLAYSILITGHDQPWAYFDSFARLWEFCLGALLAAIAVKRVPQLTAAIAGWAALAAIISCGLIFRAADSFPGLAALWPTIAAAVLLTVGSAGGRNGVHVLLASRPMVALGGVSYHLYLWHWPILIFWLADRDVAVPTDFEGMLIIAAAVALAFLTTRLELPLRRRRIGSDRALLASVGIAVLVVVALHAFVGNSVSREGASVGTRNYPGAAARAPGAETASLPDVPLLPTPIGARRDVPRLYDEDCYQKLGEAELTSCDYGTQVEPAAVIVLVGGSHSAHYLPAFEALAGERRWKIVTLTKSACRWDAEPVDYKDQACIVWNRRVTQRIIELKPALVVTTANVAGNSDVPRGFIVQWKQVAAAGIPILAIRDNPTFPFDVPECVERHGAKAAECSVARSAVLSEASPEATLSDPLAGVTFADLSRYFCDDVSCPPAYGNVLIYRDRGHLTASYARTLAPFLGERIDKILRRTPGPSTAP